MKKFFLIIAAILLAFGATAQTTYQVNDTNMGRIEKYPSFVTTLDTVIVNNYFTETYDTNIVYDTVNNSVDTTFDTIRTFDTTYTYIYDTTWIDNSYDYRAVANEGYALNHWEVVSTYATYYIDSTCIDSIWSDTIVLFNIDTVTGENYDGWLMLDGGIPDIDVNDTAREVISISITAFFEEYVGINDVVAPVFKIYPNPTTGMITVDGDFDYAKLYTMNGRQISESINGRFNLQNLPKGLYIVVVMKDNTRNTYPVIKQ